MTDGVTCSPSLAGVESSSSLLLMLLFLQFCATGGATVDSQNFIANFSTTSFSDTLAVWNTLAVIAAISFWESSGLGLTP